MISCELLIVMSRGPWVMSLPAGGSNPDVALGIGLIEC